MDNAAFAWFDGLRQRHFPPQRNFLAAHITLFHKLPGEELETVVAAIGRCIDTASAFPATASSVRFLGRGVAFDIDAAELVILRKSLAESFKALLEPQDRQKFSPHVTVQNKVEPEAARALHRQLQAEFVPFPFMVTGLCLWYYRGGPWELAGEFALPQPSFRDAASSPPSSDLALAQRPASFDPRHP